MEYVDGVALDALLSTGTLPLPAILFVIAEVLRGLAYMHALPPGDDGRPLGIVHRDVSPHNILLSWDGGVQLADLGIAKQLHATRTEASKSRGKDQYMSPEQAAGLPLDGRSDVFVAGILLWEMFAGTPPACALHEVTAYITRGLLPRGVEAVLLRMLERRAEDRPSATAALRDIIACDDYPRSGRDELAAILRERLPHRAPTYRDRAAPTGETQEPTLPLPQDAHGHVVERMLRLRRSRRRKVVLAALLTGALSLSVYGLLETRAAVEPEQPVVDLSSMGELPAPGALRLAAPERAPEASVTEPEAPVTEPVPPRLRDRPPVRPLPPEPRKTEPAMGALPESRKAEHSVSTPEAPPAVPDFIVIEIHPDKPGPDQAGETQKP